MGVPKKDCSAMPKSAKANTWRGETTREEARETRQSLVVAALSALYRHT